VVRTRRAEQCRTAGERNLLTGRNAVMRPSDYRVDAVDVGTPELTSPASFVIMTMLLPLREQYG